MLSFQPKLISKELLAELPERSRKVLVDRFGLMGKGEERTLDAIGKEYNITRERVRQIENHGIVLVRESDTYEVHTPSFEDLKKAVATWGSVVAEEHFLDAAVKNAADRNHVLFLLTVGHAFENRREDNVFRSRWFSDRDLADSVERALTILHDTIEPTRLTPEEEFIQIFNKELRALNVRAKSDDVLKAYLGISKRLGKNPLGEWGKVESPHVRIKNTRDFAYLTLKRHGSPMHFTEVARGIEKLFKRKTHPATTHNELIKDGRFVLVGRGLYALKEWGYEPGVVRDVIRDVLSKEGPLKREDIIERVKRERYVKDATIAVNLQNGIFTKLSDGRYALAK
jgi:hypothetical protein